LGFKYSDVGPPQASALGAKYQKDYASNSAED